MKSKHLLGLENMPRIDIQQLLDTGFMFRGVLDRPIKKVPALKGVTIVNLFFEPSTRTRISFELAAKRLLAEIINFSAPTSSLTKGETIKDTIQNLEAMKLEAIVVRHSAPGSAKLISEFVDSVVINAGDGAHEHPTQGMLDMMSIKEKHHKIKGLKIALVGDIKHSRVAMSNIHGLKTMGAEVWVCGPPTLIPRNIEELGVHVIYDLEEVIQTVDVLNVLRIQRERQEIGLFPSIREYRAKFGITMERLARAPKDITIMHPGPMNRGVEIDSNVAESGHSIILDQVLNGVAVRMSILYHYLGGKLSIE